MRSRAYHQTEQQRFVTTQGDKVGVDEMVMVSVARSKAEYATTIVDSRRANTIT